MTHPLLLLHARFTERATQLVDNEIRIVAEAIRPARLDRESRPRTSPRRTIAPRLIDDTPPRRHTTRADRADSAQRTRAAADCSRRRALDPPDPRGHSIVCCARRDARPARRPRARSRRRRSAARCAREKYRRLGERVLLERRRYTSRPSSSRDLGDARFVEIDRRRCHARRTADAARAAFPRCASRAARGARERVRRRGRDAAPRRARARPFTARSSKPSSSARSNVPCSPVPCTSTNRPSLLITTFISTAARTSSS